MNTLVFPKQGNIDSIDSIDQWRGASKVTVFNTRYHLGMICGSTHIRCVLLVLTALAVAPSAPAPAVTQCLLRHHPIKQPGNYAIYMLHTSVFS